MIIIGLRRSCRLPRLRGERFIIVMLFAYAAAFPA